MKEEKIVNGKLPSLSAVLCLALATGAHAQTPPREDPAKYPSRLIRMTVGFTAGGSEQTCRQVQSIQTMLKGLSTYTIPNVDVLASVTVQSLPGPGILATYNAPNAVVARIARDLDVELHEPAMRDVLARQGLDPAGGAPERFATLVRAEITRWKRVVATAGIQPE